MPTQSRAQVRPKQGSPTMQKVVVKDQTVEPQTLVLFPDGVLIDDDVEIFIDDEGEAFFV